MVPGDETMPFSEAADNPKLPDLGGWPSAIQDVTCANEARLEAVSVSQSVKLLNLLG